MTAAPAIQLEAVSKSFGPVQANKAVDLEIQAGRILALLGENGAGKSTLMSILAGRLQPDSGRILADGAPVRIPSTRVAHQLGIGMVYQHFMLIDSMTVAQNVLLGQEDQGFWLRPAKMEAQVAALAESFGLGIDPAARVADLSMGERQRVEILKLLHRRSRVLIFDEPTAVLTPQESQQLFQALREMAARGKAIVFISHKLDEVMAVADDIAILRKGRITGRMTADKVASKADLAREMVGRAVVFQVAREPLEPLQSVLRIDGLSGNGLDDVHLQLRQGEILGLVGVAGNGQKALVETICGLREPSAGEVLILGRSWTDFYAAHTWDGNLVHIPEDRRGLATCLSMTLLENFLLTTRRGFARGALAGALQSPAKSRRFDGRFRCPAPQPHGTGAAAFRRQSAETGAGQGVLPPPASDRRRTAHPGIGCGRHRGCLEYAAQSAAPCRHPSGHRRSERSPEPFRPHRGCVQRPDHGYLRRRQPGKGRPHRTADGGNRRVRTDRVPSGLHIRHGRAGDNNLLAVLGAACFREAFAAGNCPDDLNAYIAAAFRPERQAAELADPHSVFLIACAGKEAVGYAHLRNGPPPVPLHARSPLEIARFYARAGWIGKGVGPGPDGSLPVRSRLERTRRSLARGLGAQSQGHRFLWQMGIRTDRQKDFQAGGRSSNRPGPVSAGLCCGCV